jgi:iron complex transport system substrate-binding protein
MNRKAIVIFSVLLLFVLVISAVTGCTPKQEQQAATRTITDMLGRTIEIPAKINTALGTSPPSTTILYTLSPDTLMGWNYQLTDEEKNFITAECKDLPVVGGWFGKQTGNYENFIAMGPDVIFEGYNVEGDPLTSVNERQQKLGTIPVIGVEDTVDATNYEKPIRFMGDILGVEDQAKAMIAFYTDALDYVSSVVNDIPDNEKKTVYYAEGPAGLMTDPTGSQHSQLIEICGGKNIAECPISGAYGRTEVSIEEVLKWNPEVIIAGDAAFYGTVFTDTQWQNVTAVQSNDVYFTPLYPCCWFDRPPSMNRIIGILWTAKILYPDRFEDLDMESKAKEFYSIYYHYDLSSEDYASLQKP